MSRFVTPLLFALAAAIMAGSSVLLTNAAAAPEANALPQAVSHIAGVPSEALPESGRCRIFFDNVAADKQPAQMECEHARWLAHSWGGRVVETEGLSAQVVAQYQGRNDFAGVPSDAPPPRGYCRAWLNDVPVSAQPEASDCLVARRVAEAHNGRVLFMPI